MTGTMLFKNETLPSVDEFDFLIIMGGPMNIYEDTEYPWLVKEKAFIREAIDRNKIVLGICLGSQLIADVLGGKVYKGKYKEIGWFPITLSPEAKHSPLFRSFPEQFVVFHWHGDTFDIPLGAKRMGQSKGCPNQGFVYKEHVIGLQFHLESTTESIDHLLQHCADELVEDRFIQKAEEIRGQNGYLSELNTLLHQFLDRIESSFIGQ